jgi:hypothetical protein
VIEDKKCKDMYEIVKTLFIVVGTIAMVCTIFWALVFSGAEIVYRIKKRKYHETK